MIQSYYGQKVTLKNHQTIFVWPEKVICKEGIFDTVGSLLRRKGWKKPVSVIMDPRTQLAAGERIWNSLKREGYQVQKWIFDDDPPEQLICDEKHLHQLEAHIPCGTLLIAVGSGVINDLCKWLANRRNEFYLCCATAASMNGFTSPNVAATLGRVKDLIRTQPPRWILTEPTVLVQAPYRLTTAGVGDLIAKSVSSLDWWLNHYLFDDEIIPESLELSEQSEHLLLDHIEGIPLRDHHSFAALFDGLSLTGVAMTLAGSSVPASGGEHLFSHTLDMLAYRDGWQHDLHGRQVGVGTLLTARLWQSLLSLDTTHLHLQDIPDPDINFWKDLTPYIMTHFNKKRERIQKAKVLLHQPENWEKLCCYLQKWLPSPKRIEQTLKQVHGATSIEDLGIDLDLAVDALWHAHEMRSRWTCLDLAHLVGLTRENFQNCVVG